MGKILVLNTYIRKEETSQINDLSFHLKKLENEEQIEDKSSRRKETFSAIKTEDQETRSMKLNFSFEKINKIDKLLARWIRKKRKKKQTPVSGVKLVTSQQVLQIIKNYRGILRTLYAYKIDNLDEVD